MNSCLPSPTAVALAFGLLAFSSISYSGTMTISDPEITIAQATSKQPARGEDRSIRHERGAPIGAPRF